MHILLRARELFFGATRRTRAISAVGLFFALCAFGAVAVAPSGSEVNEVNSRMVAQELALPDLSDQIATLEAQPAQEFVRQEKIRSGDTIATLFSRLGINDNTALAFIKADGTAKSLLHLRAGRIMQAKVSASGELLWLSMDTSDIRDPNNKDVVVTRNEKGFVAVDASADLERRIEMKTGVIKSSLFGATDAASIPDPVTMKFVDIFSGSIDFRADLRRGDRFNIVYETFWQNGAYIRSGRILAAEFVNDGKAYQAVWFDQQGDKGGGYYGFDGKAQKKAFLKSPVAFTRISSGFGTRVHPVSGYTRAHKGIDFAAPSGTPVRAAADGTVEVAKYSGGYGNLVVLKHWSNISTAYGHMSRFASGLRKGQKVRQGDVIGYVGSTGVSTGPHLHYEYRIHSVQHNPRSIDMPEAQPLTVAEMKQFRLSAEEMEHRFALLNPDAKPVRLAKK